MYLHVVAYGVWKDNDNTMAFPESGAFDGLNSRDHGGATTATYKGKKTEGRCQSDK